MKEFFKTIETIYLFNFSVISSVVLSILLMFFVQFQVESLQDEMIKSENEIISYQDQIQVLEVEWVYLTRPERLRTLASRYLKDNGYVLANQIKDVNKFEEYHLVRYKTELGNDYAEANEQLTF